MSTTVVGTVKIRSSCSQLLKENSERISVLFSTRLSEKKADRDDGYASYDVHLSLPSGAEKKLSADLVARLQVGPKETRAAPFPPELGRRR